MNFESQLEKFYDKDDTSLKMGETTEKSFTFPKGYNATHLTNDFDLDTASGYQAFPKYLNIENLKNLKTIDFTSIRTEELKSRGLNNLKEVNIGSSKIEELDFSNCLNLEVLNLTALTELKKLIIKGCKNINTLFLSSCYNLDLDNIVIDGSINLKRVELGNLVHHNNKKFKTGEEAKNYLNSKAQIFYNKDFEGAKDVWDSGLFSFKI